MHLILANDDILKIILIIVVTSSPGTIFWLSAVSREVNRCIKDVIDNDIGLQLVASIIFDMRTKWRTYHENCLRNYTPELYEHLLVTANTSGAPTRIFKELDKIINSIYNDYKEPPPLKCKLMELAHMIQDSPKMESEVCRQLKIIAQIVLEKHDLFKRLDETCGQLVHRVTDWIADYLGLGHVGVILWVANEKTYSIQLIDTFTRELCTRFAQTYFFDISSVIAKRIQDWELWSRFFEIIHSFNPNMSDQLLRKL
jgi:hypothetical protein